MKEFMYCDFNISDITLACFVGANMGRRKHENRPSHGLALHLDGDKEYHFSDGRIVKVKKNDIIYLPKKSTYFVKINAPKGRLFLPNKIRHDFLLLHRLQALDFANLDTL